MRKLQTQTSFMLKRNEKTYLVTLQRLKNSVNGVARYKAFIANIEEAASQMRKDSANDGTYAHVYTFTGHYSTELIESNFILDQHLKGEKQ